MIIWNSSYVPIDTPPLPQNPEWVGARPPTTMVNILFVIQYGTNLKDIDRYALDFTKYDKVEV